MQHFVLLGQTQCTIDHVTHKMKINDTEVLESGLVYRQTKPSHRIMPIL